MQGTSPIPVPHHSLTPIIPRWCTTADTERRQSSSQDPRHRRRYPERLYRAQSPRRGHLRNQFVVLPSRLLLPSHPDTPGSTRSYTPLKVLGNGSFGTVTLCDWHGTLPPGTPLSPMQCGQSARPQYAGMRLVAVKRMRRRWEGGWDECQRLKELEVRRSIYPHDFVHSILSLVVASHPFSSEYHSSL